MNLFPFGHATHPQWQMAAGLVIAQLRAQMTLPGHAPQPRLGLLYITDHYANEAEPILAHFREELPMVQDWAGTVGVGVAANNAEYFDEPGMALMLCDLPADQYRVFSGAQPLPPQFKAHSALVHADPQTPDLAELIAEMAGRTQSGYLFGGLTASRNQAVQFAWQNSADPKQGVLTGGLSGVAWSPEVQILSRVTQGCAPISKEREITEAEGHVVYKLDGLPALDVLMADLKVSLSEPQGALKAVRSTLVGLTSAGQQGVGRAGSLGADVRVRHIVGLDPARQGVAIADHLQAGQKLTFCAHCGRGVCQLLWPRWPALWWAQCRASVDSPRFRRCAFGWVFCKRRNRSSALVWLHRCVDGIHHACRSHLNNNSFYTPRARASLNWV